MSKPSALRAAPPRQRKPAPARPPSAPSPAAIRAVHPGDLDAVVEIDSLVTGLEKRDYWQALFGRYANAAATGQHFLVAEVDG